MEETTLDEFVGNAFADLKCSSLEECLAVLNEMRPLGVEFKGQV